MHFTLWGPSESRRAVALAFSEHGTLPQRFWLPSHPPSHPIRSHPFCRTSIHWKIHLKKRKTPNIASLHLLFTPLLCGKLCLSESAQNATPHPSTSHPRQAEFAASGGILATNHERKSPRLFVTLRLGVGSDQGLHQQAITDQCLPRYVGEAGGYSPNPPTPRDCDQMKGRK